MADPAFLMPSTIQPMMSPPKPTIESFIRVANSVALEMMFLNPSSTLVPMSLPRSKTLPSIREALSTMRPGNLKKNGRRVTFTQSLTVVNMVPTAPEIQSLNLVPMAATLSMTRPGNLIQKSM